MLNRDGQVLVHENPPSNPESFLEVIAPYRDDLVVALECIFTWYWLADLCAADGIPFVLGHALLHPLSASRLDCLRLCPYAEPCDNGPSRLTP